MSIIKIKGPIDVRFAFKIFSLPVPTRPGARTFWQVPDPSRPEVKNPYPSDPAHWSRCHDSRTKWTQSKSKNFEFGRNQPLLPKSTISHLNYRNCEICPKWLLFVKYPFNLLGRNFSLVILYFCQQS